MRGGATGGTRILRNGQRPRLSSYRKRSSTTSDPGLFPIERTITLGREHWRERGVVL